MKKYIFFLGLLLFQIVSSHNRTVTLTQNKLNILFVVDKFPWYTKTIIMDLAIGLAQRGHKVSVFSLEKGNQDENTKQLQQIYSIYYHDVPENLNDYDIIYCQYGNLGVQFAELKAKGSFNGKLVTCFRGADVTSKKHALRKKYNLLFKLGDLFLPVCDYYGYRLKILGCPAEKIEVVYSPLNCEKFISNTRSLKKNSRVRLISVGRLTEKKGIGYVIKTVALVSKFLSKDVIYTIVGDGPLRNELEALAKKNNVGKRIKFLGWKKQLEIARLLKQSHIFLLPSVTTGNGSQEGIANALKEAMSTRMPVITTYHAGNLELIEDGKNGFLVPERSVKHLFYTLKYLIKNPKIMRRVGIAARNTVKRLFDKNLVISRLESLFFDLVKNK